MKSKGPLKDIWDNLKEKWQDSSRDEYRRPNFFQPPDPFGPQMDLDEVERRYDEMLLFFRENVISVSLVFPILIGAGIGISLSSMTPAWTLPLIIVASVAITISLCILTYKLMNYWLKRFERSRIDPKEMEFIVRRLKGLCDNDSSERPEQSGKGIAKHIAEIREDLRHAPSTPLMGAFLIVALFIVGVFFSLMH